MLRAQLVCTRIFKSKPLYFYDIHVRVASKCGSSKKPPKPVASKCGSSKKPSKPIASRCTTLKSLKPKPCGLGKTAAASSAGSASSASRGPPFKRAEKSAPCRFGFLPDNWFTFFRPLTGVSGPYVFGLVLLNYCLSKEIYVMEHEYYLGLSIFTVIYTIVSKAGHKIGAALDKQVDAHVEEMEKGRKDEIAGYTAAAEDAKKRQWMAQGQEELMKAKKENIALQLEAEYRERMMMVHKLVKGRMDYHVKRYYTEARIQQKWMVEWILKQVMHSITADFEQRALDQAIKDLTAAASRAA